MSDGAAGGAGRRARAVITLLTAMLAFALLLPTASSASGTPPSRTTVTALTTVTAAKPCTPNAPLGKYGGTLSFQLASVKPQVVTSTGGNTVTITGRYTNTGKSLITDLGYKFQRGEPLTSTAQIKQRAAHPCQPVAVIESGFVKLPGALKAGAAAPFTASVRVTGGEKKTLAVTRPGVYPIMININATIHLPDGPMRARVGELHLMLTVLSVPGATGQHLPGRPVRPGIPFNILWPITDKSHLGVGGVFLDDDLADEIAPGGRLANLVDTLGASRVPPDAITLVIDPMLLDELDRMSQGYWVVAQQGTPQPALTPTARSTTSNTESSTTSTSTASTQSSSTESSSSAESSSTPPSSVTQSSVPTAETSTTTESGTPSSTTPTQAMTEPADDATSGRTGSSRHATGASGEADVTTSTGGAGDIDRAAGAGDASTRATGTAGTDQSDAPTAGETAGAAPSATQQSETTTSSAAPSTATTRSTGPAPGTNPGPRPKGTVAGTGSAAAAHFLDRLRALASTYQVLVLPYADPDAVALVRAGMTDDLATAVYRGRAVAARVLQQPVTPRGQGTHLLTTMADPVGGVLDTATMQALAGLGYQTAVLSADSVTSTKGSRTPRGAVAVRLKHGSIPTVVTDASLTPAIGDFVYSGVPANAASQVNLLAALMAQQHGDGTGTPMVLAPDRDWSPNAKGISFITSLLETMDDQGVVTGTPLPSIAATVADHHPTTTLRYPTSARHDELTAGYLSTLQQIDGRIDVLQEALAADPGPGGGDPADILDPLQQALLPAVSASLRGTDDPEQSVLDTVTATLDSLYDGVHIHRSSASYTLASSTSPLLLTVQNTLPYEVSVGVRILGGGRVGLTTHDPGLITLPAGPRTKPVKIAAQVARSGTFTIYAQLRGPHGATWGSAVPLTIASRAYGALTLVLMLVAGGVLVLMVAFRIHQRWRGYRARQAAGGNGHATIGSNEHDGAGNPGGGHPDGGGSAGGDDTPGTAGPP